MTRTLFHSSACGREAISTRIVRGKKSHRNRYPWLVSLLIPMGEDYSSCGASLINDRYILTAAHCLTSKPKASEIIAMLGAYRADERFEAGKDQKLLPLESYVVHKDYRPSSPKMDDDIAIIKLVTPIAFDGSTLTKQLCPVCLPAFSEHDNLFVYGWGLQDNTATRKLKQAMVVFETYVDEVENATCSSDYWGRTYKPEKEICAGTDSGTCQGDSGGSLSVRNNGQIYQVGVVSFGPRGCGVEGDVKPDIYERVTAHMDWIEENTKDAKWCYGPHSPLFTQKNAALSG